MRQLNNVTMSHGQDPDVLLTQVYQLPDKMVYMGDAISDERLTDIIIEGLIDHYDQIRYNGKRDPDFSVSGNEVAMRNMYYDRVARGSLTKGVHGRESAMVAALLLDSSATSTNSRGECYSCGKPSHHMRDCCSERQANNGNGPIKLCKLYRVDKHDNPQQLVKLASEVRRRAIARTTTPTTADKTLAVGKTPATTTTTIRIKQTLSPWIMHKLLHQIPYPPITKLKKPAELQQ